MTCLDPAQLAAIATSSNDDAHLAECARCRELVEEQRAMRRLVARAPFVAPDRDRVERLAAEVMAQSDRPAARPRWRLAAVVAAVAAAAIVAVVLRSSPPSGHLAAVELPAASSPPDVEPPLPPPLELTPPSTPEPATVAGHGFTRRTRQGRDELVLRDGAVTVDGRDRLPVDVTAGDTRVRVGDARVAVKARRGAIVTVTVIAGSAEITRAGRVERIEAGVVWEAPAEVASDPYVPPDPVSSFSAGWSALRDGHLEAAIAAFDAATDPAVAEDATYWAAVAAERLHHVDDARRRFDLFLVRFPDSSRAFDARAALIRLDDPP